MVVCAAFTIAGLVTLSGHYKKSAEADLSLVLNTRINAVEQYLTRVSDICLQITSRTKVRNSLEDYNRGKTSLSELVQLATPILKDAMNLSRDVAGISRFDANGHLAVQVGLVIPGAAFAVPAAIDQKVVFLEPIIYTGKSYLPVFAPIINRKSERVGTDLVLFSTESLQKIVADPSGLGDSGEMILAVADNGNVQSLFPRRQKIARASEILPIGGRLGSALAEAIAGNQGLLQPDNKEADFIAFAPLSAEGWGLAVKIDAAELQATEKRASGLLTAIAAAITATGIVFILLLFRPLTRSLRKEMTERLAREKELQLFRDLLDCANDAIFIVSPAKGRFLDLNETACTALGYPRQELLLLGVADVDLNLADTTKWHEFIAEVAQKKQLMFVTELKRKDATTFPVEINARYVAGDVDYLVADVRDVTERKAAEQLRQEMSTRLAMILESVSDAFVALDTNWYYTYVNSKAGEIFARKPEDLIGRHIWTEFPEGVGKPFYQAYYQAAEEQQSVRLEEYYPPLDRWFENRIYPTKDGLAIFFTNITERKKAEQELGKYRDHLEKLVRERTAELEKKNQELERFNKLFIDREFRIKELKERVKEFEAQARKKGDSS